MTAGALILLSAVVLAWCVTGSWRCRKCHEAGPFWWAVVHIHRDGKPWPQPSRRS